MKKIVIAALAACVMGASAFADGLSVKSLNLSLPYITKTLDVEHEDSDEHFDVDSTTLDFDINYNSMSVSSGKDWGFSFIFGVGAGYTDTDIETSGTTLNLTGGNFNLKFGWGVAPLCRDNIVLAVHGFVGADLAYVEGSKYFVDYYALDFDITVGADCVCVIPLSDGFGLTAGLDIGVNAGGAGILSGSNDSSTTSFSDSFSYSMSGVYIVPRFGICWIK